MRVSWHIEGRPGAGPEVLLGPLGFVDPDPVVDEAGSQGPRRTWMQPIPGASVLGPWLCLSRGPDGDTWRLELASGPESRYSRSQVAVFGAYAAVVLSVELAVVLAVGRHVGVAPAILLGAGVALAGLYGLLALERRPRMRPSPVEAAGDGVPRMVAEVEARLNRLGMPWTREPVDPQA